MLEYFNSTHGARKGLADTALKTANSGYLTRRLVDVAQDCIITEEDCGTDEGLTVSAVIEGGDVLESLSERILGRTAAEDVKHPITEEVIVEGGEIIDEAMADDIENAGIDAVRIRSVLTCKTKVGVCGACYGRDLARGTRVNIGEAVGVIAAQSIGEPGTQLTMRTFHIGGAAQRGAEQSSVEATMAGTIKIENRNVVTNSESVLIVMNRTTEIILADEGGRERARHRVPYGSRLLVDEVRWLNRVRCWLNGTRIRCRSSPRKGHRHYVDGRWRFDERGDGRNHRHRQRVVADWKQQPRGGELRPRITLRDDDGEVIQLANGLEARYFLSVGAVLSVSNGVKVQAGDVIARIPRESTKTRDITGGLPRVAELFEARKPTDYAIISEGPGRVEFGKDYKTKRRVIVRPDGEDMEPVEYLILKQHIAVQEGDWVEKGDLLMDGNPVPHDILSLVEALADYLTNEIQEVYRLCM